jgi:hypothetical protein
MGKRLDLAGIGPAWEWPSASGDTMAATVDVGEDYHAISPDLLIEKGDEYLHPCGRFIPFPLEAIGRPLSRGLLARRPSSR